MRDDRFRAYRHVVFHAGLHKTGSSYLQSLMVENRAALAEASIHYPLYRPGQSPQRRSGNHSRAVRQLGKGALWTGLSRTLGLGSGCATLLISAEELDRPEILDFVLTRLPLEAEGVKVTFVAYMRRYDHLLESAYAQAMRHGESGPLVADARGVRFHAALPRIVRTLGRDALILRPYAPRHWPHGSLGLDFLTALGRPDLWPALTRGRDLRRNVSLSRAQTYLLSLVPRGADKRDLLRYLGDHPVPEDWDDGFRYFLSPDDRRALNQACLVEDKDFFAELGIADPADFLDLVRGDDDMDWVPFQPRQAQIEAYLSDFFAWQQKKAQPKPGPIAGKVLDSSTPPASVIGKMLEFIKNGGKMT